MARRSPPRDAAGRFRPAKTGRRPATARRPRRNPATAQLEHAFETALGRISRAKKPAGERRWERSAELVGNWLDKPADDKAMRQTFATVRGKGGRVLHIPLRYPLQAHDRYQNSLDSHSAYRRRIDHQQEQEDAFYDSLKHEAAAQRQRNYSPERARAGRERRKREISVSPKAGKAQLAAAQQRAEREGKTLVVRKPAGGSGVHQAWFARRYGYQGTPD